jgi:cbb3-type cytochrome oxidase maturation protein
MMVMFLLIGVSLMVAGGFLLAFIFSVKNGQYDDTHTPAIRMLFDDDLSVSHKEPIQNNPKTEN